MEKFSNVDETRKLKLTKFRELAGDTVVLSKYCGVPPAKRSALARKADNASFRGETAPTGTFTLVNKTDKSQWTRGRKAKFPAMTRKIMDYILHGWHSGAPVSKLSCYTKCREWCKKDGDFFKQYVDPAKDSAKAQLCHWMSRLLHRMGFSSRKETVSQKIPDDWKEQSIAFSKETLNFFREKNVDVVVCADQTFLRFLLAKEELLVPTGTRRVGTTVTGPDERKGVTLMLSAFINKGDNGRVGKTGLLPPFFVFNGKTGKTLDKRYSDWSRRPGHFGSMNFQDRHWFDRVITLRWIYWLVVQFPQTLTIGLIWDACPSHKSQMVRVRLDELRDQHRLFTVGIPGGLTSILQVGDICINKPCKGFLRSKYADYEMSQIEELRASGVKGRLKIKISRDLLMTWTEEFVRSVNQKEELGLTNIIAPCLSKVGQNCYDVDDEAFAAWLASLSKNALYKSMMEAHTATKL